MNIIDSNILSILPAMAASFAATRQKSPHFFNLGAENAAATLQHNRLPPGLPVAALHEIHASEPGDACNAATFTLLMAERARMARMKAGRNAAPAILWARENAEIRRQGYLYPPGVAELGIDPAGIVYIDAPDALAGLRGAADAGRCAALGAVIIELSGKYPKGFNLTATRRLSLSAQKSSVPIFCLRHDAGPPQIQPSAAYSRWQVASAPSAALEANAPGDPVFAVNLLRYRGGQEGFSAYLEWDRDEKAFRKAPDIGAISTFSAIRTDRETLRKRA